VKNYRQQDGCNNCQHAYKPWSEGSHSYYCTLDSLPRPPNPYSDWPISMGELDQEAMKIDPFKTFMQAEEVFNVWAKGRHVHSHGICEEYAREQNEEKST
jgi:hypothetical protein